MSCLKSLHPFDRCMAMTSLYIILAAVHVYPRSVAWLMLCQTFASVMHWMQFHVRIWRLLDLGLSHLVFVTHLVLLRYRPPENPAMASAFAVGSFLLFVCSAVLRSRQRAHVKYNIFRLVFPHPLFRFLAFWFVMYVQNQKWSNTLSVFYWISVVVLGTPITATRQQKDAAPVTSLSGCHLKCRSQGAAGREFHAVARRQWARPMKIDE